MCTKRLESLPKDEKVYKSVTKVDKRGNFFLGKPAVVKKQ